MDTHCPRCGQVRVCEPQGDCWCKTIPVRTRRPEFATCLCEACLTEAKIEEPLGPRILTGRFVALEPVADRHREDLQRAASDEEIWRYMPSAGHGANFDTLWRGMLAEVARKDRLAFCVRRLSDGAIVGSTSYLMIVPQHRRAEIGWTWYTRDAQATQVNPEAKFLLLQNAFEVSGYHRIEFKTDSKNTRSRAALLKLGAKEEGIFRGHMWMPRGYWRDSVYFSILETEWPDVKEKLLARLP